MGNASCGRYGSMPRRYSSPYAAKRTPEAPSCPCRDEERKTGWSGTACDDMVVAMAYVPVQPLNTLYEPESGYPRGTIFPELDKPFLAGGGNCCG